jgi:hypothetical protein
MPRKMYAEVAVGRVFGIGTDFWPTVGHTENGERI